MTFYEITYRVGR